MENTFHYFSFIELLLTNEESRRQNTVKSAMLYAFKNYKGFFTKYIECITQLIARDIKIELCIIMLTDSALFVCVSTNSIYGRFIRGVIN